ncbi:hypothetical protein BE11_36850 [Sorangium cellulosum]|nr:hypothetical protein BE11_36850 [Sorangium cellulosum]
MHRRTPVMQSRRALTSVGVNAAGRRAGRFARVKPTSALDRGQLPAAIGGFRRALTLAPDEPRAHALLAVALLRLKRLGAALIETQTARRLSPEVPLAHLVLGRVLLAHRRPSEAREHVATARGLAPSNPAPLRGLAAVARYPDRDDRAVELLTRRSSWPWRTSRRSSPSPMRSSRAAASTTPSAGARRAGARA